MIVLVEDLLTLGVAPAEVRSGLFDGWLADAPSIAAFRAHADGLLALAEGDYDRCRRRPVGGAGRAATRAWPRR